MRRILASRAMDRPAAHNGCKRIGEQIEQRDRRGPRGPRREPFEADGGFNRLNKVFDGELEAILADINEEIWKQGERDRTRVTTRDIVAKLWSLCHVLRDDGVTYNEYVTELTYLLFLKMLAETGHEERLAGRLSLGRACAKREGMDQLDYYRQLLLDLGNPRRPRTRWSSPSSPTRRPSCASRPTSRRSPPHRQARLVLGARGRARRPLRRPAGEERRREEVRRRAVFHAAPADRLHGAPDEAAAGRDHSGPGRRHRRLSGRRRPLHQGRTPTTSSSCPRTQAYFQRHSAFVGARAGARTRTGSA